MNTSIITNQLVVELNRFDIEKKYDFFVLETSDKYIKHGAKILDISELDNNIKAIKFESGRKLQVMMYKSANNLRLLKEILGKVDGGNAYCIREISTDELEDNVLIQLLLNSLGTYDTDVLKVNNLTGHLYCFHPTWIKHGRDKNKDVIWSVKCIEISVTKELCVNLNVRTFTSELLRNKITFTKKKFEDYPKYVFSAKNTLRRKLDADNEICFIMRQVDDSKNEIKFLDISSQESFAKTKMGVLQKMIAMFNERFDGIAHIDYKRVEVANKIDFSKKKARENEKKIKSLLLENEVCIVDMIGDEYSKMFCDDLKELLKVKYDVKTDIYKRVKKDRLNICLIHNKKYYKGVNDPHDKVYEEATVQHITLEDFAGNVENAITTVIHEILIKDDIMNGQLSLFDWSELNMRETISFGIQDKQGDDARYFFMEITPEGSFVIKEQECNLFEMSEYYDCVDVFENAAVKSEIVCGLIRTADRNINVIKETGLFTLPNIDNINRLLEQGDNKLRGKKRKEELLSSCLDVKLYEENGCQYFFVGIIGEGMKPNIQRSALIRKIEGHNGANVMFEKLLPLMNVSFVRNGQLTVLPFPFKYLREYVAKRK